MPDIYTLENVSFHYGDKNALQIDALSVEIESIVGLMGDVGLGKIISEARYVKDPNRPYADVAFVVDENYQGLGIATYMFRLLIRLAKERGLQGFTADVLPANKEMMRVFQKGDVEVKTALEYGVYHLTMPFKTGAGLEAA